MASLAAPTVLTPEEYIASERKATLKSEYFNGERLATLGASLAHARIIADLVISMLTSFADSVLSQTVPWQKTRRNRGTALQLNVLRKMSIYYRTVLIFLHLNQTKNTCISNIVGQ